MNYIIVFLLASFLGCSLAVSSGTSASKLPRKPDYKITSTSSSSSCDLGGVTGYTSSIPYVGDGTMSPTKIVTQSVHKFYNGTNFVSSLPSGTDVYCLGFTIFDDADTSPHAMFLSITIGDERIITDDLTFGSVKTFWITSTEPSLTFWVTGYYTDQIGYVFYKGFTIDEWKNNIVNFVFYNNAYQISVDELYAYDDSATMVVGDFDFTSDFDNDGVLNPDFFWSMNKEIYTVYFGGFTQFTYPRALDLTLFKINFCFAYSTDPKDCPVYNLAPAFNSIPVGKLLYVVVVPGKVYQFMTI